MTSEKVPIKLWLNNLEESALVQAKNAANLPFIFKWLSLMSDAHCGFGIPIGTVLATKNNIVISAIGVDIGCGVCAIETNLQHKDLKINVLKNIMSQIRKEIPVGFNHRNPTQTHCQCVESFRQDQPNQITTSTKDIASQLGTLGGG
jgi:tRNA-splicing ligase RtcB